MSLYVITVRVITCNYMLLYNGYMVLTSKSWEIRPATMVFDTPLMGRAEFITLALHG